MLVLDGNQALTKQDLSLAQKAVDEGRAILVVLNKMDAVENRKLVEDGVTDRLQSAIWQAFGVECVAISALTGQGLENIMPAVYVYLIASSLQRLIRLYTASLYLSVVYAVYLASLVNFCKYRAQRRSERLQHYGRHSIVM